MTPGRVVVLGDVMLDVVAAVARPVAPGTDTPARIVTRPGGAGANVAHRLARLGVAVAFHGAAGDDPAGREAVRVLAAAGVEVRVRLHPGAATGTCVVIVDAAAERTMLPDQGANALLDAVPDLAGAAHLHVSGYTVHGPATRPVARAALDAARAAGVPSSVDAASAAPLRAMGAAAFLDAVRGATLLVVTADEAEVLTGTRDPVAAAGALAPVASEVVVKRGPSGAAHRDPAGAWTEVPAAAPPGPVVDTTGAGDAFMAGLLAARVAGAGPAAALRAAVRAGAEAVTTPGARPA